MSYVNKGTVSATVVVSMEPDRSGNFICDGTADDVQIQAAVDYIDTLGGGALLIKRGTYVLAATVTLPEDVSDFDRPFLILGEGWDTNLTRSAAVPIFTCAGGVNRCRNITFRDLRFGSAAYTGELLNFSEANRIRIEDCLFSHTTVNAYAIDATETWDVYLYGCLFQAGGGAAQPVVYILNGASNNSNNWRFVSCRWERNDTYNSLALHSDGTGAGSANHNIHVLNCKIHGDASDAAFTNAAILFETTIRSSVKDSWICHHLGDVVEVDQNCELVEIQGNNFLTFPAQGNPTSFVSVDGANCSVLNTTSQGTPTQIILVGANATETVIRSVASETAGVTPLTDNGTDTGELLPGATAHVGFDPTKEYRVNYFLCDGTADDVQINAAIDYVEALGGGSILLEQGDYDITATISIVASWVTFSGVSWDVRLIPSANVTCITVDPAAGAINGVKLRDFQIVGTGATGAANDGILMDNCIRPEISNVRIYQPYRHGINLTDVGSAGARQAWIHSCYINEPITGSGINGVIPDCWIEWNQISYADTAGMACISFIDSVTDTGEIKDNHLSISTYGINLNGADWLISDNRTENCGVGIRVDGEDWGIHNNHCRTSTTHGFEVLGVDGLLTGNTADTCGGNGFHVSGSGNSLYANEANNNTGAGIYLSGADADGNIIRACTLIDNTSYGVDIPNAGATGNVVQENYYDNNTAGHINDVGASTVLDISAFQFTEAINGAIVTASPTGVDVDATTEAALAWGQLPQKVQQVVRLKIWAVATDAPIGAGGQMHCNFTFNAGASNAAYNEAGKSWVTAAGFDGEETDYVADDVVHWVIEDGDVGSELSNLVAGDSFEVFATWETGADPDGATDALFRVIEVEYV